MCASATTAAVAKCSFVGRSFVPKSTVQMMEWVAKLCCYAFSRNAAPKPAQPRPPLLDFRLSKAISTKKWAIHKRKNERALTWVKGGDETRKKPPPPPCCNGKYRHPCCSAFLRSPISWPCTSSRPFFRVYIGGNQSFGACKSKKNHIHFGFPWKEAPWVQIRKIEIYIWEWQEAILLAGGGLTRYSYIFLLLITALLYTAMYEMDQSQPTRFVRSCIHCKMIPEVKEEEEKERQISS